ncbi:MAG: haloacid dehalogenase [Ruminococcaceae bacterium]|nr:haloacid dehalogenase [Oscillospiraceae bacterium]
MRKILFTCDLDNTLLHSYKHKQDGDVCIEILKEKEQGFTTPKTLELLWQLNTYENVCTVPLTTRSVEQYTRIKWGAAAPKTALVTNGTLLLNGTGIDEQWWEDSLKTVLPLKEELQRLYELLSPQESFIRVRIVDEMYLFVYCAQGVDPKETAEQLQALTSLNVQCAGKKIYLFPPAANKGVAAARMAERIGADFRIAAGDSAIDLPMLKAADLALIPYNDLINEEYKQCAVCPIDKPFSEFVLETVLGICCE